MTSPLPHRALRALAVVAALSLGVAACGDDDGADVRDISEDDGGSPSGSGSGSGTHGGSGSGSASATEPAE